MSEGFHGVNSAAEVVCEGFHGVNSAAELVCEGFHGMNGAAGVVHEGLIPGHRREGDRVFRVVRRRWLGLAVHARGLTWNSCAKVATA